VDVRYIARMSTGTRVANKAKSQATKKAQSKRPSGLRAGERIIEVQFDGLVGLTHNYAGLSQGNVASEKHGGQISSPRLAALQGLAKMAAVIELGIPQGVLPPQERPDLAFLRSLGFWGTISEILKQAAKESPIHLAQACSASAMWAANAATVTPGCDTRDGRTHMTPANLKTMLHRSIEAGQATRTLRAVFCDAKCFVVHDALPASDAMSDEGAANHTRLCDDRATDGSPGHGVHLFVYGKVALDRSASGPRKYPARQTLEASQAIARRHGIDPAACVFAQQHPEAIDAGAFHNDVVAVGAGRVLLYHEGAFADEQRVLKELRAKLGDAFTPVRVSEQQVPMSKAISTYLFNSQIVMQDENNYVLIAPVEVSEDPRVLKAAKELVDLPGSPIRHVRFMNLRESMRNGGGPACLRLRVPMRASHLAGVNQACLMDEKKLKSLEGWVKKWYPAKLSIKDLAKPSLHDRSCEALAHLSKLLDLGLIYPFQLERKRR
jgi:succinylarginine dihydrolase